MLHCQWAANFALIYNKMPSESTMKGHIFSYYSVLPFGGKTPSPPNKKIVIFLVSERNSLSREEHLTMSMGF